MKKGNESQWAKILETFDWSIRKVDTNLELLANLGLAQPVEDGPSFWFTIVEKGVIPLLTFESVDSLGMRERLVTLRCHVAFVGCDDGVLCEE
jgi:hypothetical protein